MSIVDLRLRISSEVKKDAEAVFNDMGMSIGEAVRIFLKQSINSGGLPFQPRAKIPNSDTLKAFSEIENGDFEEMDLSDFRNFINK